MRLDPTDYSQVVPGWYCWTIKDAAKRMGVSEDTLRRDIKRGRIRFSLVGASKRIREDQIDGYTQPVSELSGGAA